MWEFNIYLTKTKGSLEIHQQWAKLNAGQDVQSFADFVKIYAFFRKAQAALGVRKTLTNTLFFDLVSKKFALVCFFTVLIVSSIGCKKINK